MRLPRNASAVTLDLDWKSERPYPPLGFIPFPDPEIVALIEKYRGQIEGGVCVRRLEDLRPETEERFFVVQGKPFGREGMVPDIVQRIAERVDSPFFSVDVVLAQNGTPRLIELGDGQVSDRKKWPADRFVGLFE